LIISVNHLTQARDFILRQVFHPRIWIHLRLSEDILAAPKTNAIDVSQSTPAIRAIPEPPFPGVPNPGVACAWDWSK
jgi:hypothetical protein